MSVQLHLWKNCSSYTCAVTQHQCTATLFRAKCIVHCSELLCTTGSQQTCVRAATPMEICFSMRVCSDPTPRHCSTVHGIMHSPLLSAAVQDRFTAGVCQCSYTYGKLLFIQVCSDPTPVHYNTLQGKMHSPLLSAAVQDRFTAGVCQCSCTYRKLLFIHVCSDPTPVHSNTVQGKMHAPLLSAAVQDRFTAGVCQCSCTCGKITLHTRVR